MTSLQGEPPEDKDKVTQRPDADLERQTECIYKEWRGTTTFLLILSESGYLAPDIRCQETQRHSECSRATRTPEEPYSPKV